MAKKGDLKMSEEIKIPKQKSLGDLQDELEMCARKIACIGDLWARKKCDDFPEFTERGYAGFYFMIRSLQNDVESVLDHLSKRGQNGLIIG
jgi:hypothetical protein